VLIAALTAINLQPY